MLKYGFDTVQINETKINVWVNLWSTSFPKKHIHDFYEIVFVCNNSIVNILDDTSHVMHKNDICLVSPNNVHYITPHKNPPSYFNILIKKEYLEQLSALFSPDFLEELCATRYNTLSSQSYEQIFRLIDTGYQLSEAQIKTRQYLYHLAVIELLTSFAYQKTKEPSQPTQEKPNLIEQALALMSDPQYVLASVKDIAHTLNVSHEHLIRTFKKAGKETPNKIFTAHKLEYACTLLRATDLKIITIAEKIGFYNLHYFNQIFKEHYQITPSEYRKQYNIFL